MYVLTGTALAALIAFVADRVLGRDFVATRSRLSALDACQTTHGAFDVALLRILPIAQFCLVSDRFRTTGIKVGYLLGTVVGASSGTIVHAVLGASAMSPGSAGFVTSLAAAALLGGGGIAVSALPWRRRALPDVMPAGSISLPQITVTAVGPFCALCRSPSPRSTVRFGGRAAKWPNGLNGALIGAARSPGRAAPRPPTGSNSLAGRAERRRCRFADSSVP